MKNTPACFFQTIAMILEENGFLMRTMRTMCTGKFSVDETSFDIESRSESDETLHPINSRILAEG